MKGNLARSSKIMYAFALYPGNLLLGIFPKDTPANNEKIFAQSNPL